MRRLLLLLLLLSVSVSAADIDFMIDGKPLADSYSISPGQRIDVRLSLAPGVLVREIDVVADKPYYETLFENSLSRGFSRSAQQASSDVTISVPPQVPSGDSGVEVTIFYEDAGFNKKKSTYSTLLKVEDGSGTLGFLMALAPDRVADELLGAYGVVDLPRLDPNLGIDDLNKRDLEALGISFQDMAEGRLPQITQTATKLSRMTLSQNREQFKDYQWKGSLEPEVEVRKSSFDVRFGDRTITKSKIIVSVPAKDSISLVDSVVIIPKSVAESASLLDFSERPIIIEDDPVIKWQIANIPEAQTKDYAVIADGDVTDTDITAAAAGKKMSWITRLILWIMGR